MTTGQAVGIFYGGFEVPSQNVPLDTGFYTKFSQKWTFSGMGFPGLPSRKHFDLLRLYF